MTPWMSASRQCRTTWRTAEPCPDTSTLIQLQFGARWQVFIGVDLRRCRDGLEFERLRHRLQGSAEARHIDVAHPVLENVRRDEHVVKRHLDACLLNFAIDQWITLRK